MFGGGGPPIGGGGPPGAAQAGLPFGGIPHELQEGVDLLLEQEPERGEPDVVFTQLPTEHEKKRLTLTTLLMEYPGMLALATLLVGIIALFTQLGPSLVSYAINHGLTPPHYDFAIVVVCAVLYLVSIVVSGGAQWGQARVTGRLASWVMNDLRVKVFTHLQRLSLDFFTEEKAGVVMSRMTSDIENLQQLLQDGLAQFAIQGLTMIVITIFLFLTNVTLAAITVFVVLPPLVIMSVWFKRASERGYDKVRDGIALVLADLSESLQGVRIVTAHNRQRYNVETHRDIVGSYRDANNYTGRINGIYGPGSQLISVFGQVLILAIGGAMYLHHPQEINLGQLTAFFLYVNRFFSPIQLLVQQYNTFQQGRASVFKLEDLLETEPSVLEAPDALELPPIRGEIRFDHVSFGYDPAVPVLHGIDLTIEPGETVAFVGATGAGKSTMAKLVTRFYDPTAGRVLIDGYDLKGVTLSSLRSQLGVVPQEPFLFAGTIRDNISFARPGAPDDEVWEAIHQVGLGELVHRLPYGLDTPVHERGQSLSSGERQLIALGRAFMAEPRVLVLDEATSNLDLQSETLVEAALDVLLEGRTAVLIAHRLSTAMRADRIVVVGDGNLLEVGSHDELVALGGHYAEMYSKERRRSAHVALGGLRPHGSDEPLRRAQGDRRPRSVQVVDRACKADRHGAQGAVLQRADLLVPRADHSGLDPEDPPGGHHQRVDQQDATAARLRRADRGARPLHGPLRRCLVDQPVQGGIRHRIDLRNIIYEHFTRMSFPFYDRVQSGQLISRANSDIRSVQMYLTFAPMILVQCSIAVVAFIFMLSISVPLAFVAMISMPFIYLVGVKMRKSLFPVSWLIQSRLAEVATVVDENVNGVRVVRSFAAEQQQLGQLATAADRVQWGYIKDADLRARFAPLVQNLSQVGLVFVLLVGGWMVIYDHLPVASIVSFNLYLVMMQAPFMMLGMLIMMGQRAWRQPAASTRFSTSRPPSSTVPMRSTWSTPGATSSSTGSPSPTPPTACSPNLVTTTTGIGTSCATSICTCARARPSPSSGARAAASPPWPACSPASTTPPAARSPSTGTTCAISP